MPDIRNLFVEKGKARERALKGKTWNCKPGYRLEKLPDIPNIYWDLITECCSEQPKDRPSFGQIVQRFKDNLDAYCLAGSDKEAVREYFARITADLDLPRQLHFRTEQLKDFLSSTDPDALPF